MTTPLLAISLLLSSGIPIANTPYSSSDYSTSFLDCGVYTIHSAANQNLVLNSTNIDGNNLSLKSYIDNDNQKFVIRKELGQSNFARYRISPLKAQHLSLGIMTNPSQAGSYLSLINENDISAPNSYWFTISPGSSNSSFKLATSSTSYTKYMTTINHVSSINSQLIQDNYNSNNQDAFEWKFKKTSDLVQNSACSMNLHTGDIMRKLTVSQSGNYVIFTKKATENIDTILDLSDSSGNLLASNDNYMNSIFSSITHYLSANTDYYLNVRSNGTSGTVYLSVIPKKQVYFTSYTKANDIDTRADMSAPGTSFKSKGYYFTHLNNPTYYDFYTNKTDGKLITQHEYFMISSHGGSNGVSINPTDYLTCNQLPSMAGCRFSIWSTCHGGAEGGPAIYSVLNDCTYALGWDSTIGVNSARTFTDYIWSKVLSGVSIYSATQQTVDYAYNILGNDNSILMPIVYSQDDTVEFSPTAITRKTKAGKTTAQRKIEFHDELYNDTYQITESEAVDWKSKNQYVEDDNFNSITFYRRTVKNHLTNEYIIYNHHSNLWIHSKHSISENALCSLPLDTFQDETLYLYQINNNLDLIRRNKEANKNDAAKEDNKYISVLTNKTYTEGDMRNAYF